jgi:hypothetical protein
MINNTHLFFDPFYALIRGIRKNRDRAQLDAECTGIGPIYSFYWEVKDFFQTRPALIECKIYLHQYIESIPQPVQMEAASCLLDELTRLRGIIKDLEAEQEAHLRSAYPLLSSGKVKTYEEVEEARQFQEDRENDSLLDAVPDILEYLDEIMREAKRIMVDCFTSPYPEVLEKYIQNEKVIDEFRAAEKTLFREGLIDYQGRWTGDKVLFQSFMRLITEYDYFRKPVKRGKGCRDFFIDRYGHPGDQTMKPATWPTLETATEKFPWLRDPGLFKK